MYEKFGAAMSMIRFIDLIQNALKYKQKQESKLRKETILFFFFVAVAGSKVWVLVLIWVGRKLFLTKERRLIGNGVQQKH